MPDEKDPTGIEKITLGDLHSERKVTWSYTRKKQLKDPTGQPRYESEEIGIYITDMVPEDQDILAWVVKITDDVMATAKTQVWAGLDLDFSFDENGKPELDPEVPVIAPTPAPNVIRQASGQGSNTSSVTPPSVQPAQPAQSAGPPDASQLILNYAPVPQFCKNCGHREFYDNRTDIDEKLNQGTGKIGPDWKCKNCNKGVFRPGSYEYNQQF